MYVSLFSNSECKTFFLKSLKSSKSHNICFALDFLCYFGILSKFNERNECNECKIVITNTESSTVIKNSNRKKTSAHGLISRWSSFAPVLPETQQEVNVNKKATAM